jgi:hypothetical protein
MIKDSYVYRINTKKQECTRNYKPEQIILFSNFPLIDHEVLAFVLVAVEALLVAYVHTQQNIANSSYISQIIYKG